MTGAKEQTRHEDCAHVHVYMTYGYDVMLLHYATCFIIQESRTVIGNKLQAHITSQRYQLLKCRRGSSTSDSTSTSHPSSQWTNPVFVPMIAPNSSSLDSWTRFPRAEINVFPSQLALLISRRFSTESGTPVSSRNCNTSA